MKSFKRIIAWVMLSLLIQAGIYLYLDKFYFIDEKNVKITKLNNITKKVNLKAKVSFPIGTDKIDLSFDGSYTSYFDTDKNFIVVETSSGNLVDIPFNHSAKCIAYKWLPDTNILILAEELPVKKGQTIRFYSFDLEKGTKKDIGDPDLKENSIINYGEDYKVEIEVSTLTGVMYVKCSNETTSKIYRIDRNEDMTRISTHIYKIGAIKVASHDDLLAYEDMETKSIRTTAQKKVIKIDGSSDLNLLAADGNDNVYIGNNIDGLVNKIFYGKLSDIISLWDSISLSSEIDPKNIYVSVNGEVYINDGHGSVTDLKDNHKIQYEGELIGICNGSIASNSNGKLIFVN